MADTIQTNISQSENDYSKFSYFLKGIDVTQQNLDQMTPYIQGISRIFVYTVPAFMNQLYPTKTKNFKSYMETGYTRIDGIGDISVEFVDFEGGFAGQRFSNVSVAKDDTDTVTISLYEQHGSPVREYIDTWVNGVVDHRSGVAHYHGLIEKYNNDNTTGLKYSEANHTAEFIYVALSPTALDIEYACMLAHAFPTKVSKSHLNYESGNRSNVLLDCEYKVTKYESPSINNVGTYYLNASKISYNYLNFTPNIAESDVTDRATTIGAENEVII